VDSLALEWGAEAADVPEVIVSPFRCVVRRALAVPVFVAFPLVAQASEIAAERGGDGVTPALAWATTSFLTQSLGAEARNTPSGDGRALRLAVDLSVGGASRRGLVVRCDEATMFGDAYQFVFDFDGTLVFRLFSGGGASTLRRWDATEMPGGAAAAFSWHRLEVIARGSSFRFLYDGVELPGSPLSESTLPGPGRFGFYTSTTWSPRT
jgi:hypothetical protein